MKIQMDDRARWLRIALAAGAGLASLVICCGAFVAVGYLLVTSIQFGWIGSSLDPTLFWSGVVAAMVFAGVGLSLPALALGARGSHALISTMLSALGFGAFLFFCIASL